MDPDDETEAKYLADPMLRFGIGMVFYRNLLMQLSLLFMVISILVVPIVYIYHDNTELKREETWLS